MPENFNGIPLFIRPQGFFQANPQVAAGLYATAQQWVAEFRIYNLWDLFCGVGDLAYIVLKRCRKMGKTH